MKLTAAIRLLSCVLLMSSTTLVWIPGHAIAEEIALFPDDFNSEPSVKTSLPDVSLYPDTKTLPKRYSFQTMVSLHVSSLTPGTGNELFSGTYATARFLTEQDVYRGMIGIELFLQSNDDENGTSFVSYTTGDVVHTERHIYNQGGAGIRYMFSNLKVLFPYVSLRWVYAAVNVRIHDPYEAVSVSSHADGIAPVIGMDIHARKTVSGVRPFFNFNMEIGYSYLPTMSMGMLGTMNISTLWFDWGIGLLLQ